VNSIQLSIRDGDNGQRRLLLEGPRRNGSVGRDTGSVLAICGTASYIEIRRGTEARMGRLYYDIGLAVGFWSIVLDMLWRVQRTRKTTRGHTKGMASTYEAKLMGLLCALRMQMQSISG